MTLIAAGWFRSSPTKVVVGALLAAVCLGASVPAAHGATELVAPFESTIGEDRCGGAADSADPATGSACEPSATASAETGALDANLRLVSPMNGAAPWDAAASTYGGVRAVYHLDHPAPRLDFTVNIHVNDAQVALGAFPVGEGGMYSVIDSAGSALVGFQSAQVHVGASAIEYDCDPNYAWSSVAPDANYCVGATATAVLARHAPGTEGVFDRDYTLDFSLSKAGQDLPPGDVIVDVTAGVASWQHHIWGNHSAGIDAVVTGISVDSPG